MRDEYTFKEITYNETKDIILNYHYAQRMPSISYAFGCYEDDELIGVVTYGKPVSHWLCIGVCGKEHGKRVFELNRLCFTKEVPNLASMLVGYSLRQLKKHNLIIVSYADRGMNHNGYIYQATNFIYTGYTKRRTDKYAGKGKHSRHYQGKESTKYRKVRTSKHRYVYFACNKQYKKLFNSLLKYPVQDYPKEKNKNYILGEKQEEILVKIENR